MYPSIAIQRVAVPPNRGLSGGGGGCTVYPSIATRRVAVPPNRGLSGGGGGCTDVPLHCYSESSGATQPWAEWRRNAGANLENRQDKDKQTDRQTEDVH